VEARTGGSSGTRRRGAGLRRRAVRASAGRAAATSADAYRPPGLIRRFLATHRHLLALLAGAAVVRARTLERQRRHTPRALLIRAIARLAWPLLDPALRDEPWPVQLRRRLERLGPTYVKLGQILSLREDLLPPSVTGELRNLLNRLPAVPWPVIRRMVEKELGRPLRAMFVRVDEISIGSASIAQIHRAVTLEGDRVVLKVVKPGVREMLVRDSRLLRLLAWGLQLVAGRWMPRRIVQEFTSYTMREVDLRLEADNAETFAENFRDQPDIVFPRIYRQYSSRGVLCMEFLDGLRPDSRRARALPEPDRARLVNLGAAAIVRMLYQDGLFHADLHPGNLLVLPGPRVGFIDLGMVGRLEGDLRRALMHYYYSLVLGDAEGAARYLTAVAEPQPGADLAGFRREVAEVGRRWRRAAQFEGFSIARLVLESLARGAHFRVYFPVEMVLMTKALITYEGVGEVLLPGFDVAEVSRPHIRGVFLQQFNPIRIAREELRAAPELVDALVRLPLLVTEGVRLLESASHRQAASPLSGLRGSLMAGAALVAGAVLLALDRPWPLWVLFLGVAVVIGFRRDPP
jgi:ubiquinone biosynthesis protein